MKQCKSFSIPVHSYVQRLNFNQAHRSEGEPEVMIDSVQEEDIQHLKND